MTNSEREKTSDRLKTYRNYKGWNQVEMGAILEMGSYYGCVERVQNPYSEQVVYNIAEKLGIDVNWLLTGTGDSPILAKMKTKAPEVIIPTVEVKKELAPATVPVPEPEPEPILEEKSNEVDEMAAAVYNNPQLHKPPITMILRQGVFDFVHPDGIRMSCTICWNRDKSGPIIGIHSQQNTPYNYEYSPEEGIQFAELIRFAADKSLEVLR